MASPPVDEVILLSNRSKTGSWSLVDHAVAQHADMFGLHFDDIAGLQIARRGEPRAGAGRRSRNNDGTCYQRGEGRDVDDEIAKTENPPARAVVPPPPAVYPARQPATGDLA